MSESLARLSSINGHRFGYLTALEAAEYSPFKANNDKRWLFVCDCGQERTLPLAPVRNGQIRDCGCGEIAENKRILRPDDERLAVHSGYITETISVTDILGVRSFERMTINIAPSAIDDWIYQGIFDQRQVWIIERCRDLWRDISRPKHDYFDSEDPESREDSFYSERAKNLLRRCKIHVGKARWDLFENILRWNEPTGRCGSRLMTINAESIEAAQEAVADIAMDIEGARIL